MAIERLTFNEGMMMEIIEVIRAGMASGIPLRPETEELLIEWCSDSEDYAMRSDSRSEDER